MNWGGAQSHLDVPFACDKVDWPGPRYQQIAAASVNREEAHVSYDLNAEGINGVVLETIVVANPGFPSEFDISVWKVDATAATSIDAIVGITSTAVVGGAGAVAVRGRSALNGVGVRGEVTSGTGDGVQGQGSGNFSGVAGFGGNVEVGEQPGTGVFGLGGSVTGSIVGGGAPGVRGIGGGTGPGIWELQATRLRRKHRPIRPLLISVWEAFRTFRPASLAYLDRGRALSEALQKTSA